MSAAHGSKLILIAPLAAMLLTGCKTYFPQAPESAQATPDASTPLGFDEFNSGYLGDFTGADGKRYAAMTLGWHASHPKCPGVVTTIRHDGRGAKVFAVSDGDFATWAAGAEAVP